MRHNRFKHQTDMLGPMFCGYKLHAGDTLAVLETHGQGTLTIDALTADCWIDGSPVPSLPVARDIRSWLRQDAATRSINLDAVDAATLEVEFEVGTDDHYYTTALQCRSQIKSGEDLYTSEYTNGIGVPSAAEAVAPHAAEPTAAGRRRAPAFLRWFGLGVYVALPTVVPSALRG